MEQLNNSQRKKNNLMEEREWEKHFYTDLSRNTKIQTRSFHVFLFFFQSQIPPAEIIMSRAHWGWTHRRTNNFVKVVSEDGMEKTRKSHWEICLSQGRNSIHYSKLKTENSIRLLGKTTSNCGQYGWYFGQCMKVNAEESQSKLSRYE